MPYQQIASALRALLIERNIRHFLRLVEPSRGLAVGITGARHELAKTAPLEHHGPSTVLAIFFLGRFLEVSGVEIRQVDRVLFRKRATVWITLVVRTASIERAVLAPLDHQRRTAPFTLLVGGLLHPLDILHVLFGVMEVLLELLIELGQRVSPH